MAQTVGPGAVTPIRTPLRTARVFDNKQSSHMTSTCSVQGVLKGASNAVSVLLK